MLIAIVVSLGTAIASWLVTGIVKRYLESRGILDVPNDRSAHVRPTPRGGGLGFSVVILTALSAFTVFVPEHRDISVTLISGGILVATVGWLDDRKDVSVVVRFSVHGLAAAIAIVAVGALPSLDIGFTSLQLGWLGIPLSWFLIVWTINLYNFMDGIDGLAGSQAVLVGGVGALLLGISGNLSLAVLSAFTAAALVGYLPWNWPPAKIFMGDVGSGFLGYLFAVLAIATANQGMVPLLVWVTLMGTFFVDTTATLVRRIIKGENWLSAHNTHAYQRAVQQGFSHRQVISVFCMIGLALAGAAFVALLMPDTVLPMFVMSSGGLFLLWWHFAVARQ